MLCDSYRKVAKPSLMIYSVLLFIRLLNNQLLVAHTDEKAALNSTSLGWKSPLHFCRELPFCSSPTGSSVTPPVSCLQPHTDPYPGSFAPVHSPLFPLLSPARVKHSMQMREIFQAFSRTDEAPRMIKTEIQTAGHVPFFFTHSPWVWKYS